MNTLMYLMMAIVAEVIATTMLKASEGFTRLWPSLLVVVGYGVSFGGCRWWSRVCRWALFMQSGQVWALC